MAAAGDAAAERLGQRHDVGRDADSLIGEPWPVRPQPVCTSSNTNSRPCSSASLRKPGQEAVGRNPHAAFALDRLDHDGGRFVVDQPGHGVEIAEGGVDEAGHQRPQALVIFGLGRGGQRAERAAVEAAFEGDDLVAVLGRACSRTSLMAASLASAPELQKKAWPPKLRSERAFAHCPWTSVCQVLGTWISVATCSRTASTTGPGQWPSSLQPQPGKKSR